MGKYMRKTNISGDTAVTQPSFGVRTRAKTLALQKLQSASESTYLQLRSRRLEKLLPSVVESKKLQPRKHHHVKYVDSGNSPSPNSRSGSRLRSIEVNSVSVGKEEAIDGFIMGRVWNEDETEEKIEFERNIRERTPCSLNQGSNTAAGTPNFTITTWEMEQFFSCTEQLEQKIFTEKYNYDFVNDLPLPGRYEWVENGSTLIN
ncbi:cyclin-dependent kinase inhibitor 3-like [Impatiens glandulifera]|uniref:cyclin-dependent kinase inhibitor 3-like n=1 Tax=Impatiens glandulifera TaxID=253017 RepID=UPI001FB109E0|nr:cyclin-dependent kinase inhibitor 3-like [Impatiens glandulifera]